jgi:hypothetical protein
MSLIAVVKVVSVLHENLMSRGGRYDRLTLRYINHNRVGSDCRINRLNHDSALAATSSPTCEDKSVSVLRRIAMIDHALSNILFDSDDSLEALSSRSLTATEDSRMTVVGVSLAN